MTRKIRSRTNLGGKQSNLDPNLEIEKIYKEERICQLAN